MTNDRLGGSEDPGSCCVSVQLFHGWLCAGAGKKAPENLPSPHAHVSCRHPLARRQPCSMIEVICNDRLGKKIRVKCNEDDTIGDLKKLLAAQIGACARTPPPLLTPATHNHALPFVPAHLIS
eukprot:COSAG01_NODE_18756_length_1055_cov_2.049163_1_plen_122_part_10